MQQVVPDNFKKVITPEILDKALRIHPEKRGAVADDVQGRYNLASGDIYLSTFEKITPRVLWHEQMHKILHDILPKEESLKATIQFDAKEVSHKLEEFLFPSEKMPEFEVNYGTAIQNTDVYKKYLKNSFR